MTLAISCSLPCQVYKPDRFLNPMLAGCPDRDGDLVPDKDDLCLTEAGERSLSGCPVAKASYEVQIIKESKLK